MPFLGDPVCTLNSYNLDSERYMAKAYAVGVIIDGFGEFGELLIDIRVVVYNGLCNVSA